MPRWGRVRGSHSTPPDAAADGTIQGAGGSIAAGVEPGT
jgi:hypothetical protein